jgi:hypothetical protein
VYLKIRAGRILELLKRRLTCHALTPIKENIKAHAEECSPASARSEMDSSGLALSSAGVEGIPRIGPFKLSAGSGDGSTEVWVEGSVDGSLDVLWSVLSSE